MSDKTWKLVFLHSLYEQSEFEVIAKKKGQNVGLCM